MGLEEMAKYKLIMKTPIYEFEVWGESTSEVLEALRDLDRGFLEEVGEIVLSITKVSVDEGLRDVVEVRHDGPLIVAKKDLSHYEAIGVVLYCFKDHQATSRQIKERLSASGKKVTVPARLNEMVRKGLVFKPEERGSFYKLSTKGLKWVEEEVLPRLRR
jgi:hypothetical protein